LLASSAELSKMFKSQLPSEPQCTAEDIAGMANQHG